MRTVDSGTLNGETPGAIAKCISDVRNKFFQVTSYTTLGHVKTIVSCVDPGTQSENESFSPEWTASFFKHLQTQFTAAAVVCKEGADEQQFVKLSTSNFAPNKTTEQSNRVKSHCVAEPLQWLIDGYDSNYPGAVVHLQLSGEIVASKRFAETLHALMGSKAGAEHSCPIISVHVVPSDAQAAGGATSHSAMTAIESLETPAYEGHCYKITHNEETVPASSLFIIRRLTSKALVKHTLRTGSNTKKYPTTQVANRRTCSTMLLLCQ